MVRVFGIDFGTTISVLAGLGEDGTVTSRIFTRGGTLYDVPPSSLFLALAWPRARWAASPSRTSGDREQIDLVFLTGGTPFVLAVGRYSIAFSAR